jgi:hypothetical protein
LRSDISFAHSFPIDGTKPQDDDAFSNNAGLSRPPEGDVLTNNFRMPKNLNLREKIELGFAPLR